MNRSRCFTACLWGLGILFIIIVMHSCANKGYPEGGPKDETPPRVIAEQPARSVQISIRKVLIFISMNLSL